MALTNVIDRKDKTINQRISQVTVTFDNSYTTNGKSFTASDAGMSQIDFILFSGGSGYTFEWDSANNKIKVYSTAATEVTNATDLSSVSVDLMVFGK